MHRLADRPRQRLEEWPGDGAYIHGPDDAQTDLDQGRPRPVGARRWILPDELIVGEHAQPPVRLGMSDPRPLARLRQPDLAAVTEHQEEPQRVVDRLNRVLRPRSAGHVGPGDIYEHGAVAAAGHTAGAAAPLLSCSQRGRASWNTSPSGVESGPPSRATGSSAQTVTPPPFITRGSTWNHTIWPKNMVPLPRARVSTRRHSNAAGAPSTRSGATCRLGRPVTPARVHSSSSGGHSALVWFMSSTCARLTTFTTNSPVSLILRAVSFSRPR